MNVVYKYRLMPSTPVVVEMPRYSRVIHVGAQDDGPVLWALVDTDQPKERFEFWVYGTGHPIDVARPKLHLGSVQTESGFVWHVFAVDKDREWAASVFPKASSVSDSMSSAEPPSVSHE
jgi:hypothetical protein